MPEIRSQRCFYDTTIFKISINPADHDLPHCERLLDASLISWTVIWSELSRHESEIEEYLDALEIRFSSSGTDYFVFSWSDVKSAKRNIRTDLVALRKLGLCSHDASQLAAACASDASCLITRDDDFIDPRNKRIRHKKKRVRKHNAVQDYIRRQLSIRVLFPCDACSELI